MRCVRLFYPAVNPRFYSSGTPLLGGQVVIWEILVWFVLDLTVIFGFKSDFGLGAAS